MIPTSSTEQHHLLNSTPSHCQRSPSMIHTVQIAARLKARCAAVLRLSVQIHNTRLDHAFFNNENTLLGQCPVNPGIYLGRFALCLRTNKSRPLNSFNLILLLSISFAPTYFLPISLFSRV